MREKEFKEYISKGYNLIAISETIDDPGHDILNIYQALSDCSKSYLLESLEGDKKWSRYTIVGLPSQNFIDIYDKNIKVYKENKLDEDFTVNNPISWIEEYQKEFVVLQDRKLPEFQGGLVGFFGFDAVSHFEKSIKPSNQDDSMKTPDISLLISRELLIFDKLKRKVHLVVYAEDSIESFNLAKSKLSTLKQAICEPIVIKKNKNISNNDSPLKINYHFPKEKFISAVGKIKNYIFKGDVMQVVLSQRMSIEFKEDPFDFYKELRELNPSPYMYYLNMGDYHIVGSSPEILVRLENNIITVRPIAGTRPRGKDTESDKLLEIELLNDPKEKAEHLMLIDLGRNDIGKVSKVGTVNLTDQMIIEKYSHVMHMVSNVVGEIMDGLTMSDVIKATFPAGTVSGAPKIRAVEIIYELELIKRGIYAGAIGYLGWNGNLDTAIAIRTCVIKNGILNIQCGAGIVNDSVPELEWEETINKSKAILQAYKNLRKMK